MTVDRVTAYTYRHGSNYKLILEVAFKDLKDALRPQVAHSWFNPSRIHLGHGVSVLFLLAVCCCLLIFVLFLIAVCCCLFMYVLFLISVCCLFMSVLFILMTIEVLIIYLGLPIIYNLYSN